MEKGIKSQLAYQKSSDLEDDNSQDISLSTTDQSLLVSCNYRPDMNPTKIHNGAEIKVSEDGTIGLGVSADILQIAPSYNQAAVNLTLDTIVTATKFAALDVDGVTLGGGGVIVALLDECSVISIPGTRNYFFGDAGNVDVAGGANVGVGSWALHSISLGGANVAIGDYALSSNTTTFGNVAIGRSALKDAVTACDTTAVGDLAGERMTTGTGGTFIGKSSFSSLAEALNNTGIGGGSGLNTVDGIGNLAAGYRAFEGNIHGSYNVSLGAGAIIDRQAGDGNVAIGYGALGGTETALGSSNTVVGTNAGLRIVGSDNVFLGANAGSGDRQKADVVNSIGIGNDVVTTADNQIVIGDDAVDTVVLAGASFTKSQLVNLLEVTEQPQGFVDLNVSNTNPPMVEFFGSFVAEDPYQPESVSPNTAQLTSGDVGVIEVVLGGGGFREAIMDGRPVISVPGQGNYFFGEAGNMDVTGSANVAVGSWALHSVSSGYGNVAVGDYALASNSVGFGNVAVGRSALKEAVTARDNTAIGDLAGEHVTSGTGGTFVGKYSFNSVTEALGNTGIGDSTGRSTVDGVGNLAAGYRTFEGNVHGSFNVALGAGAMLERQAEDGNIAVGYGALGGRESALGAGNTVVGTNAGWQVVGDGNIFLGATAGSGDRQKADVVNSIGIGSGVVTTANNQIVIGNDASDIVVLAGVAFTKPQLMALLAGVESLHSGGPFSVDQVGAISDEQSFRGSVAQVTELQTPTDAVVSNYSAASGFSNNEVTLGGAGVIVAIMDGRPVISIPGARNYFFGDAGNVDVTGGANVAVGSWALRSISSGGANVAVGDYALSSNTTTFGNVAVGRFALKNAVTACDTTAVGDLAGEHMTTGTGGTFVGKYSFNSVTEALNNTGIGDSTGLNTVDGVGNLAAGYRAFEGNLHGSYNVSLGARTMLERQAKDGNIAVGYGALGGSETDLGSNNSVVGANAGWRVLGSDNILLGARAGSGGQQKKDVVNSIGIGNDVDTTADNQIVIGNDGSESVVLAGISFTKMQLVELLGDAEQLRGVGDSQTAVGLFVQGDKFINAISGNAGNDYLDGGAGADLMFGKAGDDNYVVDSAGDLVIENFNGGNDSVNTTLAAYALGSNVENLRYVGSHGFVGTGNELANVLAGSIGADTLNGMSGNDTADYSASDKGVFVNLAIGMAVGGHAQGDRLISVENVVGSSFNDVLGGDGAANVLNGRSGIDAADYSASDNRVVVNLTTGYSAGGYAQGDVLIDIEDLVGTRFSSDVLTGNNGDNWLAGLAGVDTLNGMGGSDAADYSASDNRVVVNLMTGYAAGGHAQGDVLIGVENLVGSRFDSDILTGDNGSNTLAGLAGADILNGMEGFDTVDYSKSDKGVVVKLASGAASGGHAQGDKLVSIENIVGSSFADMLGGDVAVNVLNGGDGSDVVDWSASDNRVVVNLTTGYAAGGHAQNDKLLSIENLIGSSYDRDILTGDYNDNMLAGLAGADTMNGMGGIDVVDYSMSTNRVVVNLTTGYAAGGHAQGDILLNIENLMGSEYANDILVGDGGNNWLAGLAGADTLNGMQGGDTADYSASDNRVVVNLLTGYAAGGHAQGDTLIDIENVVGSNFGNDVLTGNGDNNVLTGRAGADTFNFVGQFGSDVITDFQDELDAVCISGAGGLSSQVDVATGALFTFVNGSALLLVGTTVAQSVDDIFLL